MKKLAALLILLFISGLFADEYRPLSAKEKKVFLRAFASVADAYQKKNYAAIKTYCPDLIAKYGSILLDAKSENLRPQLNLLQEMLLNSKRFSIKDSLYSVVEGAYRTKEYEKCAIAYQRLFLFFDQEGVFDSLKQVEMPKLYECIHAMYNADPSYSTFGYIDKFQYTDRMFADKMRSKIETGFEQKMLSLSSELNVDSLIAFKENYPGIFTADIVALIEKAKDKLRLSIIRKPTPGLVKVYYDKFGGPDEELETSLERAMYAKYYKERTKESAEDYMYRFPKGRNVETVNEFLIRIQPNVTIPNYDVQSTLP